MMNESSINYIDRPSAGVAPRRRSRAAQPAHNLQQRLLKAVLTAGHWEQLVSTLLGWLRSTSPNVHFFHAALGENGSITWPNQEPPTSVNEEHVTTALISGQSAVAVGPPTQIVVPILCRKSSNRAIVGIASSQHDGSLANDLMSKSELISMMKLAATHATMWQIVASERNAQAEAIQRDVATTLVKQIAAAKELRVAAQLTVEHLCRALGSNCVALLTNSSKKPRLTAISGNAEFDDASPIVTSFVNVGVQQNAEDLSRWDKTSELADVSRLLTQYSADGFIGIPLHCEGKHWATLLIACGREMYTSPQVEQFLRTVTPTLSAVLNAKQHPTTAPRRWVASQLRSVAGIATLVTAAILLIPWPYQVYCDVTMQPTTRRFVTAPFDGTLKQCLVEPGQQVPQGELLAQLDGRDLQVKLENLRAEHEKAATAYATALEEQNVRDSQQAKLDMKKLDLDIQLVQSHLEQLNVHSPVSGVVVSGDLRRVEGGPLTVGQTMFEIAPTDKMVVEIRIPERDINYVESGDDVTIRLNAFPAQAWHGEIQQVHPRAEVINDEVVFVAEVPLDNEEQNFRPGLSGRANISGPRRPLGWNLFHRAFQAAAIQMGW